MDRNARAFAALSLGTCILLGIGVVSPATAGQGGDGSDRGDTQRATVSKTSESHEVIRYGDTPSDNYTFKYNARYGDSGSYQASELTKVDDGRPYIQESHSRDVQGSGRDRTQGSAHFVNNRTERP
ncbi:hypothetical protein [Kocuria oceani]|uniref:Uncharacterized protein n=1 Tax=Kocuria oceani TaxID=988827 RepID=A0ABV9TFG3_9MICC|nr:hypothetical protein [Kocuria oceani]